MTSIRRLLQIMLVLLAHTAAHYGGRVVRRSRLLQRILPPIDLSGPERLKTVLESLGGSFVKLGQMLALQPDILPLEYCYALYNLLDRVNPVPCEQIKRVFQEETGRSTDEVFDSFEETPIASGSIGQVHVGYLRGWKVAVKVQRPDTEAGFHRDVKLMRAVVWLITRLHLKPISFVVDPLTEFATWTVEELDFRREARYMKQLRKNAVDNPRERIPAIVSELATRRVLVVEFLEGVTLMDHMRMMAADDANHAAQLERAGYEADNFARAIIDNFLGDAFRHGIFHADLHPANLMIMQNNVVGYIDFGITGVISSFSRQNLVAMTLAYARKDIDALCARFFEVSTIDDRSDPEAFRAGIKRMSEKWYKGSEDDPRLKTTTTMVMLDMLRLSREAGIWPQRDVIKYIRSAIAIDGLIRQFDPGFDVGHYLAVACRRYLSWHARKSLFSHDALINWSKASADLMRHGAFRFSSFLERVGQSRTSGVAPPRRQRQWLRGRQAQGALLLAVVVALAAVAFASNPSFKIGVNLFTSQLLVAGAALALLWRQWTRPSSYAGG